MTTAKRATGVAVGKRRWVVPPNARAVRGILSDMWAKTLAAALSKISQQTTGTCLNSTRAADPKTHNSTLCQICRIEDTQDRKNSGAVTHLVDGVPLLDPDLLWSRADLRRYELLQVSYCVVFVALHPHLCIHF